MEITEEGKAKKKEVIANSRIRRGNKTKSRGFSLR